MPLKLAQKKTAETKATRPGVFGGICAERRKEREGGEERRRKREWARVTREITRGEVGRVYRRDGESGTSRS